MRRFLLIFACAFSFCVRSETNVVFLTDSQLELLRWTYHQLVGSNTFVLDSSTGRITARRQSTIFPSAFEYMTQNQERMVEFLHMLFTGDRTSGYNVSENNILAYASSLKSRNDDFQELLELIEDNTHGIWLEQGRFYPYIRDIFGVAQVFHADYTNNFNKLYEFLTNLNLNVSISNQTAIIQSMDGVSADLSAISNLLAEISERFDNGFNTIHDTLDDDLFPIRDDMNANHRELMDFLHSLSNTAFFASNLCNCCSDMNSNYQDSVVAMLAWMTNQWSELGTSDPAGGEGNSNSVWSVWIPSDPSWSDLLIPNVVWEQNDNLLGWRPRYLPPDEQYDGNFKRIATQYYELLKNYEAGDIDGQKFFTGLVDLQLHIMANMSVQLYMIDQKMPTKTNLWEWIEQYKSEVQERVAEAQSENAEAVSQSTSLLDYTPFSIVGGHFPKVSSALNSLKVEEGVSPVVRIPIPRALRVSDSDELIVDVRESELFTTGRNWCRWIFTFIWGWLFIRLGLVPIFYVFFFTVRVAEISVHLVFMGSISGSSGIVSSFGAAAVDMVLSLIGIDTDFKKFVWGIMRN